ncbi:MAG: aminopeptidase P family protein [Pseudomonadota bacterium]
MFQNFEASTKSETVTERIALLRKEMLRAEIDVFLIPHSDTHQNEYLPPNEERLAWISSFDGSAGFAIVSADKAVLFVDGRYTIQARNQTDTSVFEIEDLVDTPPSKWIEKNLGAETRIGFDPWLFTISQKKTYEKAAEKIDANLISTDNLVDRVWQDRPAEPVKPVTIHPIDYAGVEASQKLADLRQKIGESDADMILISDLASIAWLFNIRGSDIIHTPLTLAFALIPVDGKAIVLINPEKLDETTKAYLAGLCEICAPDELQVILAEKARESRVYCSNTSIPSRLGDMVTDAGGKVVTGSDLVALPRAIKNEVELEGAKSAHLRDGVAVTQFLAWLDRQTPGTIDEISAATQLENLRSETARRMNSELMEISFDTISGAGPHGAIVHYRVTRQSNAMLLENSLYLVDSGGQYRDGTTDITRTVALGTPPNQAITDFTLVLKGHIAISTARFPAGTRGIDMDVLARNALWKRGLDYAHGTGHGVGSFLSVHEGPQSISRRSMTPLKAGMIISNEPGLYREGKYGIRIENLIYVEPAQEHAEGNVPVHSFGNLTWVPIDLRLVDPQLLLEEERTWLNDYHAHVRELLTPWLDPADCRWLEQATRQV